MNLSKHENEYIKSVCLKLNLDVKYEYDQKYGRKYSCDEIKNILASVGLEIDNTELELLEVNGVFQLTKQTLINMGKYCFASEIRNTDKAAKFSILCILWGYASQGYGRYRVEKIVKENRRLLGENTLRAFDYLQKEDLEGAYDAWQGKYKIKGLGESFITKILYFLSKIINENIPIAVIKDSYTSDRAANLFGFLHLRERGLKNYLDYMHLLKIVAEQLNTTCEVIEESLFSTNFQFESNENKVLIEKSFSYGKDYLEEYTPPAVIDTNNEYSELIKDSSDSYRFLLVSDGKPETKLKKMTYGSINKNLIDGFYSDKRNKIIKKANYYANLFHKGTATLILTTGFGAITISSSIPQYNIPGEIAIKQKNYWDMYKESILKMLDFIDNKRQEKILIVYYAGGSKKNFRKGIFDATKKIIDNNSDKYDIRFCMYGATRHPNDKWEYLEKIYNCLGNKEKEGINKLRENWINDHKSISPFFKFIIN